MPVCQQLNLHLKNNAKVLLITHLGRPTEGSFEEQFSLKPLVKEVSRILECKVDLVDSLDSSEIFNSSSECSNFRKY